MTRRTLLQAIAGGSPKPHIVLFISDDHGYRDSPLYGNAQVRTPSLEAIARGGAIFQNLYGGSPTCVPSRAILMSGLMSARNGAEANHSGLSPGIRTLPSYLAELGYKTVHFGKGHFQPAANYADWEAVPSEIRPRKGLYADLDTSAVERWLAARPPGGPPVCAVVNTHSPHVYWDSTEGYDPGKVTIPPNMVDTPETRQFLAAYYADITKMDRQLGEVYASVRKHLGSNTAFFYIADNGAQWPFAKWSLYDGGIRLPMVVNWPGRVATGTRKNAMISTADFLPTFLELAGGRPSADIDGRSFAPVLLGKLDKHRDEVFSTHTSDGDMNVFPCRSVRTARYKYILNLHPEFRYSTHMDEGVDLSGATWWRSWKAKAASDPKAAATIKRYQVHPAEELYDVRNDPWELTNLAGSPALREVQRDLRRRLEAWMERQGDRRSVMGKPKPL